MFGLTTGLAIFLIICLFLACFFEFINGFHDTANAVATVIYTNSMKPTVAVVYSGILNFTGVLLGGITVAMGIVIYYLWMLWLMGIRITELPWLWLY